jgi:hypothetical protein
MLIRLNSLLLSFKLELTVIPICKKIMMKIIQIKIKIKIKMRIMNQKLNRRKYLKKITN